MPCITQNNYLNNDSRTYAKIDMAKRIVEDSTSSTARQCNAARAVLRKSYLRLLKTLLYSPATAPYVHGQRRDVHQSTIVQHLALLPII